ncbi:MAG: cation-translocating P-type ATPase [Candidatus Aureabacteria bacterium]|nr:cation-translocating P-type ATPase [Candidatus Auribacterota bacterium]
MALTEEDVKSLKGLSEKTVADRLETDGYNELPSSKKRGMIAILFEAVKEPMFLLLVICGTIYFFIGETGDALMLLGFVCVMIVITVYQEGKTEHALEALRDLSSPRALVIREGMRKRIAGREVVRDDVVILSEGDRVPADGIVLWGRNLTVDESLLTGESVPVRKLPVSGEKENMEMSRPGGDDLPFVYSGTLVVQGQGVTTVKSTGIKTEIGKIGKALQVLEPEETLLQKETGRLVKIIFLIAITLFILIIVIYGLTRGNWLDGILSGITLAMATLPEEFPVVLTLFLALGARRLSRRQVLTRKMSAVETLGAATVLCTDKTGTITQNQMTIKKICSRCFFDGGSFESSIYDVKVNAHKPLPEEFHELIEFGILASKKDPFDPMDKALKQLGKDKLSATEHLHENWTLIQEYPLSREMLALSHVWQSQDRKKFIIAAKGAPEAMADLCHLSPGKQEKLSDQISLLTREGLRVLGVARAFIKAKDPLPEIQHDFNFKFLGLIGLEDPVRPMVPEAVRLCYEAGIKVVMITGDYPKTAQHIAGQIALKNTTEVITGQELGKMHPEYLQQRVRDVNIFARVVPEQKLSLVNAFKANGEIVAMTGDGVNDAPALKNAHIGVAMGERGTDVAREASALVLVNDDFSSIVEAVKMGRKIFDNLKKAMAYIVSVHIPIAGLSLIPVIFQWNSMVLLPVHIVFLELIIDPACSIAFEAEPEEPDSMKRKPRNPREPLFGKRTLFISVIQGLVSLLIVMLVFKISVLSGQTWNEARTICFTTLIISNLCLILTNRSWSKTVIQSVHVPNKALFFVLGGAVLFLGLVLFVPFLQNHFHFAPIHCLDILIAFAAGILSIVWFELVKWICAIKHVPLLKEKTLHGN